MPRARKVDRIIQKTGYHHGDLARALVQAAEQVIAERGPAHLTLREAARVAGVSVAAPYRHFADKETLLAAVLAKGFLELAHEMEAARASACEPLEGLSGVGEACVQFAASKPSIYRLMFGAEVDKAKHAPLLAAGHEALSVLARAVDTCAEAGLLATTDRQSVVLAGWSLCHGLSSLHADGMLETVGPIDVHRTARTLIRCLFDGVVRRPTGQSVA